MKEGIYVRHDLPLFNVNVGTESGIDAVVRDSVQTVEMYWGLPVRIESMITRLK
jgi:hypothetical protein